MIKKFLEYKINPELYKVGAHKPSKMTKDN